MTGIAVLALPISALLIWALLRSPLARRVVATPTGERWHTEETPTFGGVGIVLGLLGGVGAAIAVGAVQPTAQVLGVLGGCALLFAAGLVDDVRSLPPAAKVAVQLGAAAIVIGTGTRVEVVHEPVIATAMGLVWLVGMTNAFNLLDNMDGLAATLAGIASVFFAIDAVTEHPSHASLAIALAVACACAGFLPFNLRPRRAAAVFMGDSGSQVLGFALATLGLSSSWKVAESTVATLLLPVLILAVPILDTALVTVIRLIEGRPVYRGGRDHTSHRLVYHGLTEKRSVVLLALISAGLGGTSLAYSVLDDARVTLVGVLLSFAMLVQFAGFLADVGRQAAERPHARLQRFAVHRRRLVELLVDFALITAAFAGAYLLRVDGAGTAFQKHIFTDSLPVILGARFAVFIPFGLYRGVWRYAGTHEAARVVAAVVASEGIAVGYLWTRTAFGDFSRDIYFIDAMLCSLLIGGSRFAERGLYRLLSYLKTRGQQRRTLVVGAGRSGRSLVRELRETPGEVVVGFVDDDERLRRRRLLGVPVLGGTSELERIVRTTRPDTVLVTIPDAPRERLDAVVDGCASAGVACRFVRRQTDLDPLVVLGAAAE